MIVNEEDEKDWEDPIVAEIHAVREELAQQLDNDPKKIFEYYLQKQKEGKAQGRKYVTLSPKLIGTSRTGTHS